MSDLRDVNVARHWRDPPKAAVAGPATALMITAVLGILVVAFMTLLRVWMVWEGNLGFGPSPEEAIMGAVELAQTTIQLFSMGIVVWGATKMRRLESYGFAMSASVLMMLPWTSPCCLLGLPFGIWAVTVLNREEVKEAFQGEAGLAANPEPEREAATAPRFGSEQVREG